MSMEYIRKTYGVPAKRGGRIEYTDTNGAKFRGVIRSADGGYIVASLDGLRKRCRLHPTWQVRYL